jgi:hypothetical protein
VSLINNGYFYFIVVIFIFCLNKLALILKLNLFLIMNKSMINVFNNERLYKNNIMIKH